MNIFKLNNYLTLEGEVASDLKVTYRLEGTKYYRFYLKVYRKSSIADILPISVAEDIIKTIDFKEGMKVRVKGSIRAYNKTEGNKSRMIFKVYAQRIETLIDSSCTFNRVSLVGCICKKDALRETPLGRNITGFLVATHRSRRKSDYIPVLSWGRNAKFVDDLKIGDCVKIEGRLQSREYTKTLENGETITKVVYEVSSRNIEVLTYEEVEKAESAVVGW